MYRFSPGPGRTSLLNHGVSIPLVRGTPKLVEDQRVVGGAALSAATNTSLEQMSRTPRFTERPGGGEGPPS